MSAERLRAWLGERVPVPAEMLRKPLREELPVHLKQWLFCLGGTPLLLFFLQVATGILLTFYYVPYPAQAYDSVRHITFSTRFGWFIRGLHHGASQLMFVAVLLHMIRVFVTRAYRAPRELTWVMGASLFFLTMGLGFTGYSLVYDQLSYWATTVGTNLIAAVPLIGRPMLWMLRGGPEVKQHAGALLRFPHRRPAHTVRARARAPHRPRAAPRRGPPGRRSAPRRTGSIRITCCAKPR
jgi:quinol-cytochrome oxidoreductase complex cytochrome b subunit